MTLEIQPIKALRGELRPPSDKSLTHRAYMLASIAEGSSTVRTPLRGEDCEATLRCLAQMGLQFEWLGDDTLRLIPADAWKSPDGPLDCGNSGTTMRLLSGLIASRPISATLVGDASLSKRPMKRIADPLRMMGARIEGDTPPLRIEGRGLIGIKYNSPVPSAQIKSAILLAGLKASGRTSVTEPSTSRDHTERMLRALGVSVRLAISGGLPTVSVAGGSTPRAFEFSIPGDISSAAFFMVAATLLPDSELKIRDLSVNPTRTGLLDVLEQAGASISRSPERVELGEPVADVTVASAHRKPFEISGSLVPRLIDEIPVLAVLATQCEGTSVIKDAGELRVKESDRIELIASGLAAMGATIETSQDGMAITGPTPLRAAHIEAHLDHRIAMAFAIAGLIAEGTTTIEGAEAIATSFPHFTEELRRLSIV